MPSNKTTRQPGLVGDLESPKAHNPASPHHQVPLHAADLLEKVKLTYAGSVRSGSYSGGMKRRLSVAMALLGDPKIVYLDEPTTGMVRVPVLVCTKGGRSV
jgi:ABC-type glutathione transport system ATPase component